MLSEINFHKKAVLLLERYHSNLNRALALARLDVGARAGAGARLRIGAFNQAASALISATAPALVLVLNR